MAVVLLLVYLKFDHFAAAVAHLWRHFVNQQYKRDELITALLRETIDHLSKELDELQRDVKNLRDLAADEYKRELLALLIRERDSGSDE